MACGARSRPRIAVHPIRDAFASVVRLAIERFCVRRGGTSRIRLGVLGESRLSPPSAVLRFGRRPSLLSLRRRNLRGLTAACAPVALGLGQPPCVCVDFGSTANILSRRMEFVDRFNELLGVVLERPGNRIRAEGLRRLFALFAPSIFMPKNIGRGGARRRRAA